MGDKLTRRHKLAHKKITGSIQDETLILYDLKYVESDSTHHYYKCPCGSKDHCASQAIVFDLEFGTEIGVSDFLHCYEHNLKWFIWHNLVGVLAREEDLYFQNLEKFPDMEGRKVTAKEAFRLRTEQGCPEGMLEIDDMEEYERLWSEHKRQSGAKNRERNNVR